LIGVALFESTGQRWLLLVFPNTFEYFFIAIEAYKLRRNPNVLTSRQVHVIAAFIWIFVKLPQEWWIHVAELDVTDVLKDDVFGHPDGSWWGALAHRPWMLAIIAAAALGLYAALDRASSRLPHAEWERTWHADAQGAHMGWAGPRGYTEPFAFFGWTFIEKVVLASAVAFIFANMLPGVNARIVGTVLFTTYLVFANTVISHWLARRGVSWRSTGSKFVAMLVADLAALVPIAIIFGGTGEGSYGFTVVFTGLLTLIIVIYDDCLRVYVGQREPRHPLRARTWRFDARLC
jgi:hypothetical protein